MNSAIQEAIISQLQKVGVDPDLNVVEREIDRLDVSLRVDTNDMMQYCAAANAILEGRIRAVGILDGQVAYRRCDNGVESAGGAFTLLCPDRREDPIYHYFMRPETAVESSRLLLRYLAAINPGGKALSLDAQSVILGAAVGISGQVIDEDSLLDEPDLYKANTALDAVHCLLWKLEDHGVDGLPRTTDF